MTPFARSSTSLAVLVSLAACSSPMMPTDAATVPGDTGVVPDAGPFTPSWSSGPDYPDPIAFGSALVLPAPGGAYLYVIGGASGTFGSLAPFHAEIRRALIQADGSLGAWEDAGHINTGHADNPLAGGGAIRVYAEDGSNGMAIAGGGGASGYLGLVLAGYVQSVDGSVGLWGAFPPQISTAQGGEVFGSFNSFEAHQLALVGGMQGTTPIDHVIIAATMAGTMVPIWRDGPPLPGPRYGHGTVQVGAMTPDIFVIGGANATGPISDVLVTVRDATSLEVTSWATAGALPSPVVFPQVALLGMHAYVFGGVAGDPGIDPLVTSARVATASRGATGHGLLSAFVPVDGAALPEGRAGGITATFGNVVYIVGGMMGADHAASRSVIWAQLER